MKVLVFGGSGKMGSAVAWDLAKNYKVEEVGIIGITGRQENTLKKIKKWINSNKIVLHAIDVNDRQETMKLMEKYDVGAIALPNRKCSYKVVDMAIDTGLNTVDILEEYHRKPDKYEVEDLEIPSGMTLNEYGESLHQKAVKNGVTFIWWQDSTDTGAYCFGYLSGGRLRPLKRFSGSLPLFYQVGEYKGFLAWVSGGLIYLWGSKDPDIPVSLFQYMAGKYSTVGGIASPFGDLLIASYSGSNYSLAKPSGYVTSFIWKTKAFPVGGGGVVSQMDIIEIETEPLASGAKANFTLYYDKAKSNVALDSISYSASTNITKHKIMTKGPICEDFRLDIDNVGGSTTNPVKVRSIIIKGYFIKKN